MGWKENMQPASFRGAGFYVEASDNEVGRRSVVHEYPLRDLPYVEDLGRKARTYKVTAFVVGGNYMADRDALLAACEQPGPGTLVHPYLGTMTVSCIISTWREELRAGGRASFSLTFIESGERDYPAEELDFSAQAGDSADNAMTVAGEVFAETYRLAGPSWLKAAAAGDLATALGLVQSVVDSMPSLLDSQAVGEFLDTLAAAVATAEAVVSAGADAVAEVVDTAVSGLADVADVADVAGEAALEGLATLATFGAPNATTTAPVTVVVTTANRRAQAANQSALAALVRRLALSTGARAALAAEYASFEQGRAARDRLLARLDDEIMLAGDSGDDAAYHALRELYATTNRAFTAKLAGLAHVRPLVLPPAARPALVLAYDLYGDLSRADQITALNNLPHPGLPPGGEALKVLDA